MPEPSTQASPPSSYVVLLSGTHVTGKETIAASLATALHCPFLKSDLAKGFVIRANKHGSDDPSVVFGQTWLAKMQRAVPVYAVAPPRDGVATEFWNPHPHHEGAGPLCTAVISCGPLRRHNKDAIRSVLLARGVRAVFVVLQITRDTLEGRTLGAEEPELAKRIFASKAEDARAVEEGERDVLAVDSLRDVDSSTEEILGLVRGLVGMD